MSKKTENKKVGAIILKAGEVQFIALDLKKLAAISNSLGHFEDGQDYLQRALDLLKRIQR